MSRTKGPWVLGSQSCGDFVIIYSSGENKIVGNFCPRQDRFDFENRRAYCLPWDLHQHPDATLIAAAPEMLDVLERLTKWGSNDKTGASIAIQGILCDAFAAIKKAKGE